MHSISTLQKQTELAALSSISQYCLEVRSLAIDVFHFRRSSVRVWNSERDLNRQQRSNEPRRHQTNPLIYYLKDLSSSNIHTSFLKYCCSQKRPIETSSHKTNPRSISVYLLPASHILPPKLFLAHSRCQWKRNETPRLIYSILNSRWGSHSKRFMPL